MFKKMPYLGNFLPQLSYFVCPFFLSFFLSLLLGLLFLKWANYFRSKSREYTPTNHLAKNNTPTMGGLFILASAISSIIFFSLVHNHFFNQTLLALALLITYGGLGAIDDLSKIFKKKGVSEKTKFYAQIFFAFFISLIWFYNLDPNTKYIVPFFNYSFNLGWLIIPWAVFVIVGTSNGVNITDGLDGLAANSLIPNFLLFGLINLISSLSSSNFGNSNQLIIISASLAGACLGFLNYNSYPARVFMGDVGSLSLGGLLGLLALFTGYEWLLVVSGFIFVVETISVIIQVVYYKKFRQRFFKMAPLHHHFELSGYVENKITKNFSIMSWVFCLISLILYVLVYF